MSDLLGNVVDALIVAENRAGISRITCGWKKKHLPLDSVRNYWRDVHSPAISRRAGLYEYRHSPFDAVRTDLFAPLEGVEFSCGADEQLMWQSDVRYLDEEGVNVFGTSPDGVVKAHLLADIDLLVDRSTTYRAVGPNARTYCDRTGDPHPVGPPAHPSFGVFFRHRGDEAGFRDCLRALAERWAGAAGVLRVRLNLFDAPDMEAEKKAGYPIKTHPVEQQYQAWVELVVEDEAHARDLLAAGDGIDCARWISAVHAYPVAAVYTFVYGGRPTLVGLRGYAAWIAIRNINAVNQKEPALLEWMYGPVAKGGPVQAAGA